MHPPTPLHTFHPPKKLNTTHQELLQHISDLQASTNTQQQWRQREENEGEMAFGPTPAYSLSKAAANAAVRTLAPTLQLASVGGGVRLVAVCPGDVLTRMYSSCEDMAAASTGIAARGQGEGQGRPVLPEEAARSIVDVALHPDKYPGGRFYRNGKEIGW